MAKLKVRSMEAFPVRVKAKERLKGGTFTYGYYQTVLVRAVCDGVEGWGEAMTRADPGAAALLVRYLSRRLVGASVASPAAAWRSIWSELRVRGHTRGTDVEALSGIEIALFDCYAKLARKPLNLLLTKRPAREVGAFAGSLFESRGPLEAQVERVKASGLLGTKVKIGFGPGRDAEVLSEVRERLGDGMLVADANGAYDLKTAEKACRLFADLDLAWLEEPLLSDDWDGYAKLSSRNPVRLGAGESWFAGDFEGAVRRRLVRVLEPSVSRCGGIGTLLSAGKTAARKGLDFSPMTGMNSAISLAASLHVASAVPCLAVEYNPFANPLQTDLASGLPEPRSGALEVPRGAGLGLEVDLKFVRRNAA